MRDVTYSLSMSLDGYITDPAGTLDWGVPGDETFQVAMGEVRGVGVHVMGRRLYEAMLYWEDAAETQDLGEAELEWCDLWNPLPKVVFSRTLTELQGTAVLATGTVAEEIERLRSAPDEGDIAVGGAELAAQVAAAGLIDEYRIRVMPVLLGGGRTMFPHEEARVDLELVESRVLDEQVQYLRYRVVR